VMAAADVVLLSLPDGSATGAVVDMVVALDDRAVDTIVDLSTVGPSTAVEAAAALAAVGVTYVDGPVSGGVSGAVAGTISLMFAGPDRVLERHQSLLECFSGNVFVVGSEAGQGQAMKLLNNFLSATALAATSEAVVFGDRLGLDMNVMLDVLNASTGRNSATCDKFPNQVVTGAYATGFRTQLMTKDVELYLAAVRSAGTPDSVGAAVAATWQSCDAGMPGSDFSEIYRFVAGQPDPST